MTHHPSIDYGLVKQVAAQVGRQLSDRREQAEDAGDPLNDEEARQLSRALIVDATQSVTAEAFRTGGQPLDGEAVEAFRQAVFDQLHGLGRIQPLIDDPEVTDIHINGCDRVFVRLSGHEKKVEAAPVADSDEELVEMIAEVARTKGRTERPFDETNWSLDMQLPSGARLEATLGVSRRPSVTIRWHDFRLNRLAHLAEQGLVDDNLDAFLRAAINAGLTVIIAGGTGTGKTTALRALLNEVDSNERIVTVEDHAELALERFPDRNPNHVSLVVRSDNTDGQGGVGLSELVYKTLRKDPDRVIVGECQGAEALPMLKAMSQGNPGSMSTMHADSAHDALTRLPTYVSEADTYPSAQGTNRLIVAAVDLVVHIGWVEGVRRVTEVLEVKDHLGSDGGIGANELWAPGPDGRAVAAGPPTDTLLDQLQAAGFDRQRMVGPAGWWRS